MSGKILVMTRQNANQATANLTMRATSDGQSVDFTVHVVINAIVSQLSGVYTINADASQNPDFTSFGAAVSALSAGIAGEVIFEVAPGTYEEYVTLNAISGASASDRVIFRGTGADNQQVVLTSNAGSSRVDQQRRLYPKQYPHTRWCRLCDLPKHDLVFLFGRKCRCGDLAWGTFKRPF